MYDPSSLINLPPHAYNIGGAISVTGGRRYDLLYHIPDCICHFVIGGAVMATSKLQKATAKAISTYFPNFDVQENAHPDWCITKRGERLELDFYFKKIGIAVEVQGNQHYQFVPHFHLTYANFEAQKRRDEEKRDLCDNNCVYLFEVHDETSLMATLDQIAFIIKTGRKLEKPDIRKFWNKWIYELVGGFKFLKKNYLSLSYKEYKKRFKALQTEMRRGQKKYAKQNRTCVSAEDSNLLFGAYCESVELLKAKHRMVTKRNSPRKGGAS